MLARTATLLIAAIFVLLPLSGCGSSVPQYQPGPLTDSTACGVLNADQAGGDTGDIDTYVRHANPYLAGDALQVQYQAELNVLPSLLGECQANPSELLSAAYSKALDTPSPTTPDPCAGHGGEPAYAWCAQH
jgi:hypothetical protein